MKKKTKKKEIDLERPFNVEYTEGYEDGFNKCLEINSMAIGIGNAVIGVLEIGAKNKNGKKSKDN